MDPGIIQLLTTALAALIPGIVTILSIVIQEKFRDQSEQSRKSGVYLPPGTTIYRRSIPVRWIAVFTIVAGVTGYLIGGTYNSNKAAGILQPTATILASETIPPTSVSPNTTPAPLFTKIPTAAGTATRTELTIGMGATYTLTPTPVVSQGDCLNKILYSTDHLYSYNGPGGTFNSKKQIPVGAVLTCIKRAVVQNGGSTYLYLQDAKGNTYWVIDNYLTDANPRQCFTLKTAGFPEKKGYLYSGRGGGWGSTSYSLETIFLQDVLGGSIDVNIAAVTAIKISKSNFVIDVAGNQYVITGNYPATQTANDYTVDGFLMFVTNDGIEYALATWRTRDAEVLLEKTNCE